MGPSSNSEIGGQPMPEQPEVIIPDQALIRDLLEENEIDYVVDEDGDVCMARKDFRIYYLFQDDELYTIRTFYNRPYPIERKAELLMAVDEWNRDTLWPKVYTRTLDDGTVRVVGEAALIISVGVTYDHFVGTTANWVQASMDFDEWLVQRLNMQASAENDEE
ncbi:YbjN domain-containing protein [Goodfellowiella coeruleoviolacea]|nr:YbjN domain-containing protein [Goodfellowiella coeruleoviolacea]